MGLNGKNYQNKRVVLGLSANFLNIAKRKIRKINFYPKRELKELKTILNQSEEKSKTALFSFFKKMKGGYRGLKTVQKV